MLGMIVFAAAAAASPDVRAACQTSEPLPAHARKGPGATELTRLPNANLYLGVLRKEGGCEKPAIVRYDVGAITPKR